MLTVTGGFVSAGEKCDVPVSEWQPREALETKLEVDGWHVHSIKAKDGCYEAVAVDANGSAVHALYDPRTLKRVAEHHG